MSLPWSEARLGWLVKTVVPQRDKPTDLSGPIPWLRIEDFSGKYLHASKSGQGVTPEQVKVMPLRIFPARTVITSCSCTMGATAIASQDVVTNQTFIGLVPDETKLSSDFLYYLMQERADHLQSQATGAIQQYLSQNDFRRIRFRMPPIPEQLAIASFLDRETAEVDAFIGDQEELIELLNERRAATITQAVTKGLNPHVPMKDSGIEWLGKVPEAWVVGAIKHLALRITDGAHISPETEGGVYDFVSTRDVSSSGIDFEGALKTSPSTYDYMVKTGCQPRLGDVLFSKDGTVGRTVVVRSANPFVIASSLIIIRPNPARLNSGYLDYACQSLAIQEQVRSYVQGAGLPRLSISNLLKIVAVFPSLSEQEAIAAYLDDETAEIDAAIADAKESIELSKERRAALISAAVTGKIDVRNHITAELGAA